MPNRLRLWFVDDDENERFFVERALQRLPEPVRLCSLEGAQVAQEALKDAEPAQLPHVIVCDIKMPGMDGFEFLKWLRESKWKALPLVMRSNSGADQDVTRAYELGANAYHVKASTAESMKEMFESLSNYWRTVATPCIDRHDLLKKALGKNPASS